MTDFNLLSMAGVQRAAELGLEWFQLLQEILADENIPYDMRCVYAYRMVQIVQNDSSLRVAISD